MIRSVHSVPNSTTMAKSAASFNSETIKLDKLVTLGLSDDARFEIQHVQLTDVFKHLIASLEKERVKNEQANAAMEHMSSRLSFVEKNMLSYEDSLHDCQKLIKDAVFGNKKVNPVEAAAVLEEVKRASPLPPITPEPAPLAHESVTLSDVPIERQRRESIKPTDSHTRRESKSFIKLKNGTPEGVPFGCSSEFQGRPSQRVPLAPPPIEVVNNVDETRIAKIEADLKLLKATIENVEQSNTNKILESQTEISDELGNVRRGVTKLQIETRQTQGDVDLVSETLDTTKRKITEDVLTTLVKLEKSKSDKTELAPIQSELTSVHTGQDRLLESFNLLKLQVDQLHFDSGGIEAAKTATRDLGTWVRNDVASLRNWCTEQLSECRALFKDVVSKSTYHQEMERRKFEDRHVSECLQTINSSLSSLSNKADVQQVQQLHTTMEYLLKETKQQHGVLFGSRCLSCNRAYDETKEDNFAQNIDLQKQKMQNLVLKQVEKSMNDGTSRTVSDEIHVTSLKVGKLAAEVGADNLVYQSRNVNGNIDDLHLALATPTATNNNRFNEPPKSPRFNRPLTTEPLLQKIVSMPPGRRDPKQQRMAADDFKQSLTRLLGRDRNDTISSAGKMCVGTPRGQDRHAHFDNH